MREICLGIALFAIALGTNAVAATAVEPGTIAAIPSLTYSAIHGDTIDAWSEPPKARGREIHLAQSTSPSTPSSSGDVNLPPLKWAGRLQFPNPALPQNFLFCTAQFITSNILLTAAHCLKDLQAYPNGPWPNPNTGSFFLQYQNGQYSKVFNVVCGLTSPQWAFPSNYNTMTADQKGMAFTVANQHDFAMLLVNAPSPTGAMPYALDWKGKVTEVTRIGYPGDILNGTIAQEAAGVIFFADAIIGLPPNLVIQWQAITDFTQGSSGGAWIANFSTTQTGPNYNVLVAVTSAIYPAWPGGAFAGYLTAAEFDPVLKSVSNGCK